MKYIVFFLCVFLWACTNEERNNNMQSDIKNDRINHITDTAGLIFLNKIFNFGIVKQDSIITGVYRFVNTSNNKLIIMSVTPDCTCTGYTLSKDTINPKDTATLELIMDTHNKFGNIKAYAIVKANTKDELYKLTIKGSVEN